MANRFLNNITINDEYTLPAADGTVDQIMKTDGSGQLGFISQSDITAGSATTAGSADKALSLTITVKNTESVALTKGQVVCAAPSATPPSGNVIEVKLADNNGTDSMPAIGILNEGLDAAGGANDEGEAIMFGRISGINTSGFNIGDEVFVSDTPGALVSTKPTGVKYIQKIGVVIRKDASNGTIEIFGAGRTNDVPTPLYIDHANQEVGIGIDDPASLLHIKENNTSTTSGLIIEQLGTGDAIAHFLLSGVQRWVVGVDNSDSDKFKIASSSDLNTDARLTIETTGNVGIGTPSPSQKLQVEGNSWIKGIYYDTSGDAGASGQVLSSTATGTNWITLNDIYYTETESDSRFVNVTGDTMTGDLTIGSGSTDNYVRSYFSDGSYTEMRGYGLQFSRATSYIRPTADNTNTLYLGSSTAQWNTLSIDASTTAFNVNGSEKMRIDSSGNVGIGQPTPTEKLEVIGTIKQKTGAAYSNYVQQSVSEAQLTFSTFSGNQATYPSAIKFSPNGSEAMRVDNDGNVGIGTDNPGQKLDVIAGDNNGIRISSEAPSNSWKDIKILSYVSEAQAASFSDSSHIYTTSPSGATTWPFTEYGALVIEGRDNGNGGIALRTGSGSGQATRIAIRESGNVGVGTTDPRGVLDVNGPLSVIGGTFTSGAAGADSNTSAGIVLRRGKRILSGIPSGGNEDFYLRNLIWQTSSNNIEIGQSGTSLVGDISLLAGASGNIRFYASGSQDVVINSSGDVGIGTANPGSNLQIGDITTASNVAVRAISEQGYQAGFEAYGSNQGTGYMYVGQSLTYGGGVAYNGDSNPAAFDSGTTGSDKITFFRRENSADTAVMWYGYNSNDVNFRGNIKTSAYTIPNTAGTSGDVLKWPASGTTLEWGSAGGGASVTSGTFTPSVTASYSTGGFAPASGTMVGYYERVGDWVTVGFQLHFRAGNQTTFWTLTNITNLPYTVKKIASGSSFTIDNNYVFLTHNTSSNNSISFAGYAQGNTTNVVFTESGSATQTFSVSAYGNVYVSGVVIYKAA